jgi:uncharacterized repeat protein (TIGR02543 family)
MNRKSPSGSAALTGLKVVASLLFLTSTLLAADPVVSNVQGLQRPGTKLVDITYDVTADTPTVAVTLRISSDGGTTFSVPATTLTGAVGANVPVGTGKVITWNAGTDWLGNYSTAMRFEVTADDRVPTFEPGMMLVPAGKFQMGDSLDGTIEAPSIEVNVSAFYIAQHEVTNALWEEVRSWGLLNGYTDLVPGRGRSVDGTDWGDHPVQDIDWGVAVKWCNARSEKEGRRPSYRFISVTGDVYRNSHPSGIVCDWSADGYRLPTEAEWEKAARGGIKGARFPWGGNTINHDNANYLAYGGYTYDTSGYTIGTYHPSYDDGREYYPGILTSPVGRFAANNYGLYDMAGNSREWCWDMVDGGPQNWATSYVDGATDPRGPVHVPDSGGRRSRGAARADGAQACRVYDRSDVGSVSTGGESTGVRLAQSSDVNGAVDEAISGDIQVDAMSFYLKKSLSTSPNGTILNSNRPSYLPGSTATLTATPNPGYRFTGWTGDASGTDNPLTITMDADKTVGATFEKDLSDSDSDGLTAYDELVLYGTNPALADTDGDGLSDGYELGVGRFSIVTGSFAWQQARTDARSKGGDLASFPTEDRWNRALQNLGVNPFEDFTGLWIGASDAAVDGIWTWVNGETFSFAPWGTGRPSSTTGNSLDFAEVSGGGGAEIGKWYDRSPTTIRDGYLLEMGYATSPTTADTDGDGLNDGEEQTAGTNPFVADTDGDRLSDWQEVHLTKTNPLLADSNGNGISDADEDSDGDGLSNLEEIATHGTDPLKADTDGDGLSDGEELSYPGSYFTLIEGSFTHAQAAADAATRRGRLASFPNANDFTRAAGRARKTTQGYLWFGLADAATEGTWLWTDGNVPAYTRWLNGQPDGGTSENHAVLMEATTQWADAVADFVAAGYLFERVGLDPLAADTDGDGLSDGAESNTHQTNPVLDDSDGDGLTDGAEINTHSSNPKLADTDGDGLSDFAEVVTHGTNPTAKDSDADGFDDLFEINTGFNPTQAGSTPDALSTIRTAVEFRFNAGNGASYRIEGSTDLQNWETVETDIIGTGGVVTRFYSIENQPKRYFRVKRN